MRKYLWIILIILIFSSNLFCQEIDTVWVKRYNGPADHNDYPKAIVLDSSGNVYVTGQSFSYTSAFDYATLKYYPNGDTAWVRRYNGTGNNDDGAVDLALDKSGNICVTGWSIGTGTIYNFDYLTIKYQPDGETLWVRRYQGPVEGKDDAVTALGIDSSGNIIVTGHSWDTVTYDDFATIMYYPDGDTAWLRRYSGPPLGHDNPRDLCVDHSGNIYVTGISFSAQNNFDFVTIKYYPDGDTVWIRKYNGGANSEDDPCAIALDKAGNTYVAGTSYNNFTNYDYATLKYYPDGDTAWLRRYTSAGYYEDWTKDLAVDTNGNLYVTGKSYDSLTSFDFLTVKYDTSGNQLWTRKYNGTGNAEDEPTAIVLDDSGNIYITGSSTGVNGDLDFVTLKYDPSGNLLWTKRYHKEQNDIPSAIALDGSGNVFVTGQSYQSGTLYDYVTIKYNQQIFYRGDANKDEQVSVSDIVYLISYLFKGGEAPNPLSSGDCNCDGQVSVSDIVFLINYLFKGGPPPIC